MYGLFRGTIIFCPLFHQRKIKKFKKCVCCKKCKVRGLTGSTQPLSLHQQQKEDSVAMTGWAIRGGGKIIPPFSIRQRTYDTYVTVQTGNCPPNPNWHPKYLTDVLIFVILIIKINMTQRSRIMSFLILVWLLRYRKLFLFSKITHFSHCWITEPWWRIANYALEHYFARSFLSSRLLCPPLCEYLPTPSPRLIIVHKPHSWWHHVWEYSVNLEAWEALAGCQTLEWTVARWLSFHVSKLELLV